MEGRRAGVAAAASATTTTRSRNFQMQALGKMNEERLRKLRSFAADKGPELLGDLFCPWAKWLFILFKALVESDDDAKLFIARIFGMSNPNPIKSPLNILVSSLRSASEEVLHDAAKMADVRASGLYVCRLTSLMLLAVIGNFGWKWLIGLHLGLFVAQTNQQFGTKIKVDEVVFQGFHICLYILDAIATPHTYSSRLLLHMVSCVCVFFSHFSHLGHDFSMAPLVGFPCMLVMLYYTPLWFGVSLLLAMSACTLPSAKPDDIFALVICWACVCVVRGLVYVSAGGFCGALFLFLCSTVLFICIEESDSSAVEMVIAPLPLVCTLLSCFYTPFWVGLCFTSILICTLAAANDNFKAILWWFVSFAALHSISYVFSRSFSVIAICFLGSYFSYGCIL